MKRAIGVTRLKDQKPGMKWAGLFGSGGDDLKYGFEPEVCPPSTSLFISSDQLTNGQISLHGITQHTNHELVAIHHPSKTLLEADLMFNLPAKEQFSRAKEPFLFRTLGLSKLLQPGNSAHEKAVSGVLTKGQ